ncbi:oocyte zinc finger protein XlCOF15-like [Pollicipes pollicipes]|uniref:oocyte zinc finger protein XlCOF15-like n=1 Tax=Pollicipes pollicipes TaxID=41117 RepID=UPI00188584C8|nr:oocyte zinc finger protein XlCOF15-like [Pollicipes pollicipes]
MVKVEKVDIADDDDDVSLEAALGQVVNYEGSYDSDQSMSGLLQADLSQGSSGLLPGTSDGGAGSVATLRDGQLVWPCDQCDKAFTLRESLTRHRAVHRGETRCPICSKVFSTKFNLQMHLRCVHSGSKWSEMRGDQPWSCDQCDKSFSLRKSLIRHRAVHRGETWCTLCQKVFSTKFNLQAHERFVHSSAH